MSLSNHYLVALGCSMFACAAARRAKSLSYPNKRDGHCKFLTKATVNLFYAILIIFN